MDAVHTEQLREHGGLPGVRDEHVLESALARPQQRWHDEHSADLATIAAAYACGLTRTRGGSTLGIIVASVTMVGWAGAGRNRRLPRRC